MDEKPDRHAELNGGIDAQHARGKLTARERLEVLLDPDSLEVVDAASDDGVVAVVGRVNGRKIFIYATEVAAQGGALSAADMRMVAAVQDRALAAGAPLIGLFDSIGLDDDIASLSSAAAMLQGAARAVGTIPHIALVLGPCIGAEAFLAALADVTFMVRDATFYATGPEVIAALTHEMVSEDDLGGAAVHAVKSGIAAAVYDDELDALLQLRRFVDFLPSADVPLGRKSFDDPERGEPSLDSLVPDDSRRAYDVKELILKLVDEGDVFELHETHAANIVTGFVRLDGHTVGIIANQSLVLGGVLDCDALRKAARFIGLCARFDLPIVSLVDTPGFMPGKIEEERGIAQVGADLILAYAHTRSPKISIVLRNAFGPAFLMMGSKPLGADAVYAWPSAQVAVSGGGAFADLREAESARLIDTVIAPSATRAHVIATLLRLLSPKL
ncbi:MAG: acyl-CoA carboxylase subunit beta [Methylovirgula sp.]